LNRLRDFLNPNHTPEQIESKYNLKESDNYKLDKARQLLIKVDIESFIYPILYRPFDKRYIFFSEIFCERLRKEVMNSLKLDNLALILSRQQKEIGFKHCLVTDTIGDGNTMSVNSREYNYYFPLYIYPNTENQQTNLFIEKTSNLSPKFLEPIKNKLGKTPTPEKIFYYAYAIFHSPTYRSRYAEFLKIDFPRLPLTTNQTLFNSLAEKGEELVNLHLMKSTTLKNLITTFANEGNNQVSEVTYNSELQRVYINKQSYFTDIPQHIWEFKIGGYQVLDKWLKDRKNANRVLSDDEIIHYQKIVVALTETLRLMQEIDNLIPDFPIK
jgi:predicted helicase